MANGELFNEENPAPLPGPKKKKTVAEQERDASGPLHTPVEHLVQNGKGDAELEALLNDIVNNGYHIFDVIIPAWQPHFGTDNYPFKIIGWRFKR